MNYTLESFIVRSYTGSGETLREAILDALAKLFSVEAPDFPLAKAWCLRYVRMEVSRRKAIIFSAASNYDQVELIEMLAEARDYRITGNTSAARYPLASALATARGVTLISVLTAWGNAFATAFAQLATLISQQEQAEAAINNAATLAALGEVMATILEMLA
jgi:hypothetical protein